MHLGALSLVSPSAAESRRLALLRAYCKVSAIAIVTLGCLVLCGWAFRVGFLLTVLPDMVTMKANVALCFVFSGVSLWLLLQSPVSHRRRAIGGLLGFAVILIGSVTTGEYLVDASSSFDQALFRDTERSLGTTSPGRMAPGTAAALVAIGMALVLFSRKTRRDYRAGQMLSLFPGLIGMLALMGYIYHASALTKLFLYTHVALHTAVGVLLLSAALFFARPEAGFARDLISDGSGSVMARRLLPAVLSLPFLLGWLCLKGQWAGLYGTELGVALNATFGVAIFAVLVWFNARQINKEYEQRSRAELAILELNRDLEGQVAERTTMFRDQSAILSEKGALVDLANDAIFVRDMDARITSWNKGAAQKYGWTEEEAVGHVTHELLRTKFPTSLDQIDEELLAHGVWEGELYHTRADGSQIAVASRWALQRDVRGNPCAVLEINNDITERKRAEDALRLSEEGLSLLIQGVKDYAIFMLDPQGRVATWNEGAQRLKGYGAAEIVGQHFSKFYAPEAVEQGKPSQELRIALEQGYSEDEGWRVRKDGSHFWASVVITALRDKNGQLRGFGKVTRDITIRREAESMLQSLTTRLSVATAIAKIGVWEWDLSQNTIGWDPTMFEIYGLPPAMGTSEERWSAPMPYATWAAAVHPEDLRSAEVTLERTIEERHQESEQFRIIRPDGSVRAILAMQKVVLDPHGDAVRMIGVNTDVTELKNAAKVLAQSGIDQLRFKDEFLSQVSHEIRAPLSAIIQFTTIILDGLAGEITPEQRECEQIVLQNARQLQSMIVDLLDVTRMENGKLSVEPKNLSVYDAVSDILNTLRGNAASSGVTLSSKLAKSLPTAYADPIRLRQILIILVDNAIKFTPRGGSVKIHIQPWEEDPEFLCVRVSDTGTGIEPKKIDRIFERLYQVSDDKQSMQKGLGLGLFICKELVTRQGGQIWVKSKLQKGTIFSFTLPVLSLKK